MRHVLPLLILCLLVFPAAAVQIVEFCPDPYQKGENDEYIVLEGSGSLEGFRISDGEGSVRFPEGSDIDGRIVIARRADAYHATYGDFPDFEIFDTSPSVPDVIRTGDLRMSNSEDELMLLQDGKTVQQVCWPDDVDRRQGQIHYYSDGIWDPRPLLIGQSRFSPATYTGATVMTFVSPDCSREVMEEVLASAGSEVLVNIYEFTDTGIATMIKDADKRGANVSVLLEGGPVGGIAAEEHCAVALLERSGIAVTSMTTTPDAHAKYRYNHAKYIVIDRSGVLITSENFKPSGFPITNTGGNRGWGVYIMHEGLAAYFADVFTWDISGGDCIPFETSYDTCDAGDPAEPYSPEFAPAVYESATVTPVLAPDTSHLIGDFIDEARISVDIEQAYISNWSEDSPNPYLTAAVNASRRGVNVRILLDSYWYNIQENDDNDEMAAFINDLAAREGLPLEARCAHLDDGTPSKIHNKGVIVDGGAVLISSINWNENSACFNREAGVIIDHPGVGQYYTAVFENDWNAASNRTDGAENLLKIGIAGAVLILIMLLYARRRNG